MISRSFVIASIALIFTGCGGGTVVERNDISGTVTFDGQPVPFGEITFIPRFPDGEVGPTGSATIENGKYDTSVAGQGIVRGPHEIRITAYPSKPEMTEDETVEVEAVEPLFVGYTFEQILEPPMTDLEIPAEAAGFNNLEAASASSRNDP